VAGRARTTQERIEAAEGRRARRAAVTDPDVVLAAAADFLAVRSRSVEETRRRLVRLGYPVALVDQVVARLVTLGYLDDAAFARAWVESRDRARPRGAAALRRELTQKGVSADVVAAVLAARGASIRTAAALVTGTERDEPDAERAAAQRLLQKRASGLAREPDPRRRRQKAYALLARSGFSPDVCAEVAAGVASDAEE
jgi:regulatory protein